MPIKRYTCATVLLIWAMTAHATRAQQQTTASPPNSGQQNVAIHRSQAPRPATILWSGCDEPPTTLDQVARLARPVLWFSRDEPLDLSGPAPAEWPRIKKQVQTNSVVYYRIKRLKSRSNDSTLARTLTAAAHERNPGLQPFSDDLVDPEEIATLPLTNTVLDDLQEVAIRYLFYYPKEIGVGQHPHDLETAEFRFKVERADPAGHPVNSLTATTCWQIRLATVYGSAHGLGAYTNILDLDAVFEENVLIGQQSSQTVRSDPFWPIVLLVEEGKHATATDRNGDGAFTPGFDVNKYPADAWGVRDTMRTRHLAVAQSADEYKQRVPPIHVVKRTEHLEFGPYEVLSIDQSPEIKERFKQFVRYDYELRRPTADTVVCGSEPTEKARLVAMRRYAAELKGWLSGQGSASGQPKEKLEEKDFCKGTAIDKHFDISDFGHQIHFGGARTSFTKFPETIPVSFRKDGDWNWVVLPPFEYPLPGLGGSLVGKLSGPFARRAPNVEVMYMRSAARIADWYVATGIEFVHQPGTPREKKQVWELGTRIRFPIPAMGVFLGGRVGIRTNGFPEISHTRIVFELGTGIW